MILSRSMLYRIDLKHSDDPLTYHEQYLGNLIQDGADTSKIYSYLLKILLIHKHDIRYINSPRYLRLWLTFIFYLRSPLIYPTLFGLIDNKIGDKLAMLYEAIAYQQLKERRYQDVEATLLFGIKKEVYPLNKLDLALQEFKLTGSLQFDVNQFILESYQTAAKIDKHALHIAKKPHTNDPLKYHLKWINLKLQHTKRADMLRQCYKNQCSYDELKAKFQYNGLICNTNHMGQGIKKGGSNIRGFTFYYLKKPTIIPHYSNIPVQEKESDDHQQQHNVVQLPHKPGFITHQLMLSGVLDRETYHFLGTESTQNSILIKLKDWFHTGNSKHNPKRLIELDKDVFHVVSQLGQGGMAEVFLVQHIKTFAYYGLKVQQPPHPWEYYILSQIHSRKSTDLNVLDIYDFYQYNDTSFLLMYYIRNGTLLDTLNLFRQLKSYMPEPIVLIIIMHLLEELNKLHRIQIVHNDLKLENIMLVSSSFSNRKTTAEFPKIMMIDFGYSIDVSLLPPHTLCKANWPPACPKSDFPMLNQQYSPFHADYWQLASMAHLLLYGTPMFTLKNKNGVYSIQQAIRRYWHRKVWIDFFQMLLNPNSFNEKEILSELWSQFQQASQDVPQSVINSFTSMLDDKVLTK